ncbi:hypothetical protein IZY60_04110 [Lutibacter sp. B2]|nr:hypothetical protein [Lutibacter sp. B2]
MKLIIREYLSLLKESKELDRVLPDLLLAMGIEPISYPQIGVRQYGVDVAAVGKDEFGIVLLYLFTIKQGDIGRADWDGNNQSVRPSLDEILDVYIESHIPLEYKDLPKKIVLCTGGALRQEIQQNWRGYVKRNRIEDIQEYEFWGGDKLAILIEKYMFNEQIIPKEFKSKMRKTLALLGDSDHDLNDFYNIIKEFLVDVKYENINRQATKKKIKKKLMTVHLCLNIIWFWARSENNIKPAMLAAERTVLNIWEFMRTNNLLENNNVRLIFDKIYESFLNIYNEYFDKIDQFCYQEESLSANERYYILNCLNVFEVLGNISLFGLGLHYRCKKGDTQEFDRVKKIVDSLKNFINNHLAICAPCYDGHITEISQAIYLLQAYGEKELINWWIVQIVEHMKFAYVNLGKYFPIQSDSFDDLVALNNSNRLEKEKLFELSTLIPTLAQWCIALGLYETYHLIRESVVKFFKDCSLQIWYPDRSTDEYMYTINAAYKTGAMDAPMILKESIDDMLETVRRVQKNTIDINELSSVKHGYKLLPIIASKHYRMPMIPWYWQSIVLNQDEM